MTDEELAKGLEDWFKLNKKQTKIKFWNSNPVARTLKDNLKAMRRWKSLPRGRCPYSSTRRHIKINRN